MRAYRCHSVGGLCNFELRILDAAVFVQGDIQGFCQGEEPDGRGAGADRQDAVANHRYREPQTRQRPWRGRPTDGCEVPPVGWAALRNLSRKTSRGMDEAEVTGVVLRY